MGICIGLEEAGRDMAAIATMLGTGGCAPAPGSLLLTITTADVAWSSLLLREIMLLLHEIGDMVLSAKKTACFRDATEVQ